jgi:hypothetical protein
LASWYKLVPEGALPWQAGASRYLLANEQRLSKLVKTCTSSPAATTTPPSKTACRRGLTGFFYQRPFCFIYFFSYIALISSLFPFSFSFFLLYQLISSDVIEESESTIKFTLGPN